MKPGELTPKQAAFARAYVETGNASEAYRRSYDVTDASADWIRVNASQLLSDTNVALTVISMQDEARERTIVTVESITRELEEVRQAAFAAADYAPANTSIMGKAKVNGLLVDKNEHTGANGTALFQTVYETRKEE
jgi:phage terminase small subunit